MTRCAKSLLVLLAEVNAVNPGRDKASDGGIGDPAHAARASSHNPDAYGVYRARDFDKDGIDADALAEHIRKLGLAKHPALGAGAYVIWNRRICSDARGWAWRPYDGTNPHTKHLHVSCTDDPKHYDDPTPWGWQPQPVAAQTAVAPRPLTPAVQIGADTVVIVRSPKGHYISDGVCKRLISSSTAEKAYLAAGVKVLALPAEEIDAMPERKV